METPRGPLAGGEDEFADPARAPARENPQAAADVRLMPVQDDFIARIRGIGIADDDRVLRLARPSPGGPGRRATLHAWPSQNACRGWSAEKYTSLPGVRGSTSPTAAFSGMRAADS